MYVTVSTTMKGRIICNVKFTSPEGGGGGRWKTEAPQPWQKSVSLGQTF